MSLLLPVDDENDGCFGNRSSLFRTRSIVSFCFDQSVLDENVPFTYGDYNASLTIYPNVLNISQTYRFKVRMNRQSRPDLSIEGFVIVQVVSHTTELVAIS